MLENVIHTWTQVLRQLPMGGRLAVVAVCLLSLFWLAWREYVHRSQVNYFLKKDIERSRWIPLKRFERDWILEEHRNNTGESIGYKYCDCSGCYVIKTWKGIGPIRWNRECYVGQSSHMLGRVHNHVTGFGNGKVYSDVRQGTHCKIRFIQAPEHSLNKLEKQLIERYKGTESYNRTSGGGAKRRRFF